MRTLYNVNAAEGREFLEIAGKVDLSMPRKVFPFGELQDAMIKVKKGQIKEPNAIIKISSE